MTTTTKLAHFESQLQLALSDPKTPQRLQEAMRYATLNGGKRIRPQLVYATGEACGAPCNALDIAAVAVELVHCYSLVHDDLPAMDDDELRRGQPTTHIAFDEATAILAGDALLNKAFELLCDPTPSLRPNTQLTLIKTLAHAAGSQGMIAGQMLDLDSEGQALSMRELLHIHTLKTGKLISASVLLGAHAAQCKLEHLTTLTHFAQAIGLAFQLRDDLLDRQSTTTQLGKPVGRDAKNQKANSAFEQTQLYQQAQALFLEAKSHLAKLPFDTSTLSKLAEYIVTRRK